MNTAHILIKGSKVVFVNIHTVHNIMSNNPTTFEMDLISSFYKNVEQHTLYICTVCIGNICLTYFFKNKSFNKENKLPQSKIHMRKFGFGK